MAEPIRHRVNCGRLHPTVKHWNNEATHKPRDRMHPECRRQRRRGGDHRLFCRTRTRRYRLNVPARRTRHICFNDLKDPEPVPKNTYYSSVIVSSVPVVVQHTRLDTRQPALALLSTMAYPVK